MDERSYWMWLAMSVFRSDARKLLNQYEGIENAYAQIRQGVFLLDETLDEELYATLEYNSDTDKIQRFEETLFKKEIEFVSIYEDGFPQSLREIYDCPYWLFYKGRLPSEEKRRIAIVGARGCSEYGAAFAQKVGRELAERDVQVISGMAHGIDGKAHRGALNADGETFAVLGCGVDVCYPMQNHGIYEKITDKGGIISEYPPGTKPLGPYFPDRNRIISGLAEGVVVVEARSKSGSLITANIALEQGRNVYAVPGRYDDPLSEGCNILIREGAKLTTRTEDILEDFDFYPNIRTTLVGPMPNILDTSEKIVFGRLSYEPKHINRICRESSMELETVVSILVKLETKGLAKQIGMDYYVVSG